MPRRQSAAGHSRDLYRFSDSTMYYPNRDADTTSLLGSLSGQGEIDEQEQIRLVDSPDLDPKMNAYPPIGDIANSPWVHVDRPVVNQMMLYPKYDPHTGFYGGSGPPPDDKKSGCCSCLKKLKFSPLKLLFSLVPILDWLPKYEWKKDLSFDLVAGFTIAVMHIPQGMAYALLGNLPPIVGIYMAFFPVIVYTFLGTSRQVSMGTFAVICLMTGKSALDHLAYEVRNNITIPSIPYPMDSKTDIDLLLQDEAIKVRMIEIATAISLAVGLFQFVMGVLRLGSLSLLLSSELVSGFTTGAAIHVFTSQVKSLLGISVPRRSGVFKILKTYGDVVRSIASGKMNIAAFILSVITVGLLVVYNELVKPYVSTKTSFPIPVELVTIIVGTVFSFYWNFEGRYNVSVVSTIPTGFPVPKAPPMDVFSVVLLDGLIIGIVAYAISISMCKIFATKHNYTVDPNQELIAEGTSNVVGSFFSCAPIAASLSRSIIQDSVGGKTQLVGIFSASILVFVLLWIGPFFEALPNCVLSGIIVVALKGMFLQFSDLPKAWKASKVNGLVWLITFSATVILDIEYGLIAGVLLSIILLVWSSTHGYLSVLGVYSNCELYVEVNTNPQAREIPGVKILKYTGSLNFVNAERFIKDVESILVVEEEPEDDIVHDNMLINSISHSDRSAKRIEHGDRTGRTPYSSPVPIYAVIFDFSSLSSVDPAALRLLTSLHNQFLKDDVQVLFAASPATVLHMMDTSSFLKEIGFTRFFPSVQDAVTHVLSLSHNLKQQELSNINFPMEP